MNKHTRLAAGILVLVLVILIAATISFSANVSKRSGSNQNSASDTAINANGNEIVQGDNHLYGVSDAAGHPGADCVLLPGNIGGHGTGRVV